MTLSDKRKELGKRLSNFPSIAHHIEGFLDEIEKQDKEFIKELKDRMIYITTDFIEIRKEIDKLAGEKLI